MSYIPYIRGLVGHHKIFLAYASVVLRDAQGRVLLQRRADFNIWGLPGGYSNLGENAAYTVVREVFEETGPHVQPERLLGVFSPTTAWDYPNGDRAQAVVSLFRCRQAGGLLRPDRVETSQLAWVSPAELLALDVDARLVPLHQAVLEHLDNGAFVL